MGIQKGLQWLIQGASLGDVLFLHFSGHGSQQKDPYGFEEDGYNETIVPVDHSRAGQISDDEIWTTMVYPLPSGVKLMAIMDCCHSGTGLDLPFDYSFKKDRWIVDENPAHSQGDVIQLSGCQDDQTSADAMDKYQVGGAMTTAFIHSVRTKPNATYTQLLSSIHSNLKRRGFSQKPQLTTSQQFDVNRKCYSFTGGIEENKNSEIGRKMNNKKKKKKKKHKHAELIGAGLLAGFALDALF